MKYAQNTLASLIMNKTVSKYYFLMVSLYHRQNSCWLNSDLEVTPPWHIIIKYMQKLQTVKKLIIDAWPSPKYTPDDGYNNDRFVRHIEIFLLKIFHYHRMILTDRSEGILGAMMTSLLIPPSVFQSIIIVFKKMVEYFWDFFFGLLLFSVWCI